MSFNISSTAFVWSPAKWDREQPLQAEVRAPYPEAISVQEEVVGGSMLSAASSRSLRCKTAVWGESSDLGPRMLSQLGNSHFNKSV